MYQSEVIMVPLAKAKFYASAFGFDNDSVTWEVEGGDENGTITDSGVYTAPNKLGIFKVRARSVENPSISGVSNAVVTLIGAFQDIEHISGMVQIIVTNGSISYDFTEGDRTYVSDESWNQDVTYSDFLLHGSLEWNTHRGDTMTVKGSYSVQHDRLLGDKLVQRDELVALMQTKRVEHYINFKIDTATMTGEIDVEGAYLNGLKNWKDYESGDYEKDTPVEGRTFGCKVTGIPISVSPTGHIWGTRSDVPILVYTDPDRSITATVKWDLDVWPSD